MNDLFFSVLQKAINERSLQKIVYSKPDDPTLRRTDGRLILMREQLFLQLESFHSDGKATHENIPLANAVTELYNRAGKFRSVHLMTSAGDCELLRSVKGKTTLRGAEKLLREDAPSPAAILTHNQKKRYLLSDEGAFCFLARLGVCDENGRIYERKQAKYRQINRFLEIVEDIYPTLPDEGELTVCDLCCGKSYLTFAVYYYLTAMRGRTVTLYGVDRKTDVMAFCTETAKNLGFDGMCFFAMDILQFSPPKKPDLVISLHACDIATDIVLASAIRLDAKVILSTPCCHHEMAKQLHCPELSFISEHSILHGKLCDAATDALRAKYLEARGYDVTAMELIDPEETPKNVLIRAVRNRHLSEEKKKQAAEEYEATVKWLGVDPMLPKLMKEMET